MHDFKRDLGQMIGFGLAGNFAYHLEQAGEASDFASLVGEDASAPKGIFPFFVPHAKDYLGRFCFDNNAVILPPDSALNVQAEAEVALCCEIEYSADKKLVLGVTPTHFMAFNDASVRNDKSAAKLSQKKNFSLGSKGFSARQIAIPKGEFTRGGICDDYSLASFICTGGECEIYGELSRLDSYSYFYEKLIRWIVERLNFQDNFGVLESLADVLKVAQYPQKAIIAIGATRYFASNEKRFLRKGDVVSTIVFNHKKYSFDFICNLVKRGDSADFDDILLLRQRVL
ncbi:DUF5718 family protein [Helicobacter sp. 23-1045]